MENEVFERDYKEEHEKETDSLSSAILDQAISGGFFAHYDQAMKAVPKMINMKQKADYEFILSICDNMAKRWGGKVRGEVRYDHWDAVIDIYLPFVEFGSPEELENLKEMASRADSINFESTEDGGVRVHIFFYYFEDMISDEEKDDTFMDAMMSDPELLALMSKQIGADAETVLKNMQVMNEILDVIETATGKDRTDILKDILQMYGEDPEGFEDNIQNLMDEYMSDDAQ